MASAPVVSSTFRHAPHTRCDAVTRLGRRTRYLHPDLARAKASNNPIQEPRPDNSVPHNYVTCIGIRGCSVGGNFHHRLVLAVRIRQPWRKEPRPDGPIEPVRLQMDTSLITRRESGTHGRLPRARRPRHDHHFSAAKHPAMVRRRWRYSIGGQRSVRSAVPVVGASGSDGAGGATVRYRSTAVGRSEQCAR